MSTECGFNEERDKFLVRALECETSEISNIRKLDRRHSRIQDDSLKIDAESVHHATRDIADSIKRRSLGFTHFTWAEKYHNSNAKVPLQYPACFSSVGT